MQNHLPIVDADAHVIETEHTWDYLEPSEQKFRPRLFYTAGDETRQYWVIDDKIRGFRFPTLSEQQLREFAQQAGRNFETPQAARELDDVFDSCQALYMLIAAHGCFSSTEVLISRVCMIGKKPVLLK